MNAVTGRPLAVVDGPLAGRSADGLYCDLLWTDGSGRHLLVSCALGRIDDAGSLGSASSDFPRSSRRCAWVG
jgi:hypothetical protein